MTLYIILFTMFMAGAFLDITNVSKKNKIALLFIMGCICVILSGLRWERGTDWFPYYNYFFTNTTINDFLNDPYNFEPGYAVFNFLVKTFLGEYNFLLFFMALLCVFLKYKVILAFAAFPLASLALNFANCNGDLFPVRQSIAYALALFSTCFIIKRNMLLFLLMIFLACLFHMSAIVFLPAYYIFFLEFKRKTLAIIVLVAFFLGTSGIIEKILSVLISTSFGIDISLLMKINDYMEEAELDTMSNVSTNMVAYLGILRRAAFVPILIYYKKKFEDISPIYNGFLNLNIVGVSIFLLFSGLSISLAGRGSFYYSIYEVFIIPYILFWNRGISFKIVGFLILFLYCAVKYYYGLYGFFDLFVPYRTFFQN